MSQENVEVVRRVVEGLPKRGDGLIVWSARAGLTRGQSRL
jgi:hypothetical protein